VAKFEKTWLPPLEALFDNTLCMMRGMKLIYMGILWMRDCLLCRLHLMGISDCFSIVVLDGVMDSPRFYLGLASPIRVAKFEKTWLPPLEALFDNTLCMMRGLLCRLHLMGISDCFSIVVLDGVMDSPRLLYYTRSLSILFRFSISYKSG
jgi:hypothetical protein